MRSGCRIKWKIWFSWVGMIALILLPMKNLATPSFVQVGSILVMSNANVCLQYDLSAGTCDFLWQGSKKISAFYSGVTLNSGYVRGIDFSNRTWSIIGSNQVAVVSHAAGLPDMTQYFTLDQNDSFLTRVDMSGSNPSANWMGPVVMDTTGGVDIGSYFDDRALFVPFDNDHSVSYNSEGINGSDTGNEAGAFYDNTTRNGLVVGSVTHDTWKTGVYWSGSSNKLNQLNVFGGVTSHWTWDVMPHGFVTGNVISSPTIFVGFGNDWRATMENFAAENALFVPPLVWTNGVPFGWNSWGVTNYQSHINYASAIAISDSIHTNLQNHGFTDSNTVYINLDSYWNNLSDSELQNFTAHCHANGQKAGVYWGPFVFWGNANDATNYFAPYPSGDPLNPDWVYRYSELLLRDGGGNFISNDGAYAIDPTHPGTLAMIDDLASYYTALGFDYVKLDYLSHGSLEGVHNNPAVTTGIQAYNLGMQRILTDLAGRMFISESIAPIFPYQYAHSRRIACDAQTSKISNTAYTMNSVSLGWWINGPLYPFNDPDILVFDNGPNANEVQSRVINGAVTGLFLNGSILTNSASISLAQTCLTNAAINAVARVGRSFRPVDGATGTGAADILSRQDARNWEIAVFNYNSSTASQTVNLASAGLPSGTFVATNLWDGTTSIVTSSLGVSLAAKQAKLFRLALTSPPPTPQFAGGTISTAGNLSFGGGNGIAGWPYLVLTATNLAMPMDQWTVIATNTFDASGNFNFSLPVNPSQAQKYYRIKLQ